MRDAYKDEADAVARKHGLDHDLIDELEIRGLTVEQAQRVDLDHPYNQSVKLINREGRIVAYTISDHPGRAVIAALDEILTSENNRTTN